MLAQAEQDHQVGGKRVGPSPTCHDLSEDDEEELALGGLNHLFQRNAQVHSGRGRRRTQMPRSLFPEVSNRATERSKNGKKGSMDQEKSTSRTTDIKSCPSELLKDMYARARGRSQT